jgi:ribonuclease BN (tRNA processing enzyme)
MPLKAHIVFSHTHYDHVIGYPFFVPFFVPTNEFNLYGPAVFDKNFRTVMKELLSYSFFPVRLDELAAKLNFHDMHEGVVEMGPFSVEATFANHPVTTLAYRITCDGKTVVFTGDTEPYINHLEGDEDSDPEDIAEVQDVIDEQTDKWINFLKDADFALYDAQYTPEEYPNFKGWGHTSMDVAISMGARAGVKNLMLTHHDPKRTDDDLDQLLVRWQNEGKEQNLDMNIDFAQEGKTYDV